MKREKRRKLENLEDAEEMLKDMRLMDCEKLRVIFLNAGNQIIGQEEFSGSVSSVSVKVSRIFRKAVERDAAAVVLAHNHPSGKAEPTGKDRKFTDKACGAGEAVDIPVLDHVIVGEGFYSFKRERNLKG